MQAEKLGPRPRQRAPLPIFSGEVHQAGAILQRGHRSTPVTTKCSHRIEQAAARIQEEPEGEKARRLVADLTQCQQLIAERVRELPLRLRDPGATEWSV